MLKSGKNTLEKLKGSENFQTWSFSIQAMLEVQDLDKCISSDVNEIEEDAAKLKLSKAMIILAIEPHLYVHIQSCKTAIEIWTKLREMFEDKGLTRRIGLLRTLITTSLENSGCMEDFITKIIGTANKLNGIGFEISDEWVGSFLLAGLSNEYKPFIMGIESSGVKISGDLIKSRLYEMVSTNSSTSQQAFMGKKPGNSKFTMKCYGCGKIGHKRSQCWVKNKGSSGNFCVKDKTESNAFSAVLSSTDLSKQCWYLDSGASQHMTPHHEWLRNVRPSTTKQISVANNQKMDVDTVGDMTININGRSIDVKDVLCVPDLAANLLSVSRITIMGNKVSFAVDGCSIFNEKNELLTRARLIDGVYKISASPVCNGMVAKSDTDFMTWHRRLGHLNFSDVRKLNNNKVNGVMFKDSGGDVTCEVCVQSKQSRKPFSNKGKRATNMLDLVHTDLCGPMENESIGGKRYFLTFIDDYSRKLFVYFLKSKDETFDKFREFKAMVETQTERKIKILRSDNGGEYVNKEMQDFLQKCGIVNQTTIPHTPEQNGMAERMNRTIVERAKCLLFDAGLPKKFWAEAVNTATYLINRSLAKGTGKLPEEVWINSSINLSNLKVFGTRAMIHIPKVQRKKWDPKSKELIFVGYCDRSKGYRLINPETGKITNSRDVIFLDESVGKSVVENLKSDAILVDADEIVDDLKPNVPTVGVDLVGDHHSEDEVDSLGNQSNVESFEDCEDQDSDFKPDVAVPESSERPRRSERPKLPKSFDDFVTYVATTEHITPEPTTVKEALEVDEKNWEKAMKSEMDSLYENKTWILTDLPKGRKAIKTKWVFKTKRDDDGVIVRHKARLVVKGCSQRAGMDYDETYSPVIRYGSIRYLVALAARYELYIDQMDAVTAFLQGDLNEDIYVEQPEGFDDGSSKVCRLQKSMYGLKQSGRQWNLKLDEELKKFGLKKSKVDPCVYVKQFEENIRLIVAVYVDDLLIFWKNEDDRNQIKRSLSNAFKMKDLGMAKICVGLRISRDKDGNYYLDQEKYILQILETFNMSNCHPVATPSDPGQKLCKDMSPKSKEEEEEMQQVPYQQLVGALLYLVQGTRPDIAFSVGDISRYNSCFGKAHWTAAKRILRYLKGTAGIKIKYVKAVKDGLSGYCDSDWASDIDKRRSCTGYVFCLQNGAISWGSRRQPTVALSTTEAEYMALSSAIQEALWLKQFGQELGNVLPNGPVTIQCDNMGAINLAKNDAFQARSKHIDIRYHFIRDCITELNIEVKYAPTEKMVADILTKPVPGAKHLYCIKGMGLLEY